MSNPLHEMDKLFRDGIENRSEKPSPGVWDKIESDLEKETSFKYIRKYRSLKRKVSVLLLFISVLVVFGTVKLLKLNHSVAKLPNDSSQPVYLQNPNVSESIQRDNIKTPALHAKPDADEAKEIAVELPVLANNGERNNENKNDWPGDSHYPEFTLEANTIKSDGAKQLLQDQNPASRLDVDAFPQAFTADKFNDRSNSQPVSSAEKNFIFPNDAVAEVFSLTNTSLSDHRKKYFANLGLPVVTSPGSQPSHYTVATVPKNSVENGSRFSLAVQFSTSASWNRVIENKNYSRRHNNNGGGSSGGGSTGGGSNGPGGSWGGHHEDHDDLKKNENNKLSYAGSVALGYALNKKISLHTGINYLQNSSRVKDKKIYADKDDDGQVIYQLSSAAGYADFTPPVNSNPRVRDSIMISKTSNYSSYLGIPLSVEYHVLSSGKFSLGVSAGGQVNFLVNGKSKTVLGEGTQYESMETAKTKGLKPAYFSVLTGITGEMHINKKLSVTLAPAGQFGLTHINTKRSVRTRTDHLGVSAGLRFRL